MISRRRMRVFCCSVVVSWWLGAATASAQITVSPELSTRIDPIAKLEEQLINRLRATRGSQQAYLKLVVQLVDAGKLEMRLVVAVERYALQRNPRYPFPFFERALQFEARKRNVPLPSIKHFQTAAAPILRF